MNIDVYFKSNLSGEDIVLLHIIMQNSNGVMSSRLRDLNADYRPYLEKGYVKFVKSKNKNEDLHDTIRIDKKGRDMLTNLYTYSPSEDTKKIVDWVISTYKSIGKFCKNKKEAYKRCEFFTKTSGIDRNKLAFLIQTYMKNVYDPNIHGDNFYEAKKQNPYLVLSNQVENIFWQKENIFSKHYSLDNSPLYTFYLDNEEFFDTHFKKYET